MVSTRYCSKVSSKKREKQSSGVWQDGGTLGPGCSVNGCGAGAVSSTRDCTVHRYVAIHVSVNLGGSVSFYSTCACMYMYLHVELTSSHFVYIVHVCTCTFISFYACMCVHVRTCSSSYSAYTCPHACT